MEPIFKNLRVLELASVLAGPSVGQFFAELGAEVIKVENLKAGGDVTRSWKIAGEKEGDLSAYFCCCNWGKKSVAVDLFTGEGKTHVLQLAKRSDVIIASYKPGDSEKLGVAYSQIKSINPEIIYGQVSGYGSDNDRVGYDAVIQAEAGFMDLNGEAGGPPTKMPVALIDILAAHQLKEGLLLALLHKERTGKGNLVEVSLLDAAVSSLANQATNWLVAKKLPTRKGSAHPNIAPYGESFVTRDNKRILLAVGNDKQFGSLMLLLGEHELATHPDFSTNTARVSNRNTLSELLISAIQKRDGAELMHELQRAKIPAGQIQNVQEVFSMTEVQQLLLQSSELMGVKTFVASGFPMVEVTAPPKFGEHTKEVLESLAGTLS